MDTDQLRQNISANLQRIIAERGTNYRAVSEKAGLNHGACYDLIKGRARSPKIENVFKIAAALGVLPSELFGGPVPEGIREQMNEALALLPEGEQQRLLDLAKAYSASRKQ